MESCDFFFLFYFRDKEQKRRRGLGLEERNSMSLSCLWVSRPCRNYILCLLYVTRLLLFTGKYLYPHFQKDIYIYIKKKITLVTVVWITSNKQEKKKRKKASWHLSSRLGSCGAGSCPWMCSSCDCVFLLPCGCYWGLKAQVIGSEMWASRSRQNSPITKLWTLKASFLWWAV